MRVDVSHILDDKNTNCNFYSHQIDIIHSNYEKINEKYNVFSSKISTELNVILNNQIMLKKELCITKLQSKSKVQITKKYSAQNY